MADMPRPTEEVEAKSDKPTPAEKQGACTLCGKTMTLVRSSKRFCSSSCRKAGNRGKTEPARQRGRGRPARSLKDQILDVPESVRGIREVLVPDPGSAGQWDDRGPVDFGQAVYDAYTGPARPCRLRDASVRRYACLIRRVPEGPGAPDDETKDERKVRLAVTRREAEKARFEMGQEIARDLAAAGVRFVLVAVPKRLEDSPGGPRRVGTIGIAVIVFFARRSIPRFRVAPIEREIARRAGWSDFERSDVIAFSDEFRLLRSDGSGYMHRRGRGRGTTRRVDLEWVRTNLQSLGTDLYRVRADPIE